MKKTMKTLTILTMAILMSSFSNTSVNQFIGTYAVCSNDPSQIKLIINSDQTYYYQDFSVSDKKIIAKGSWTLKGNKVVLKDNNTVQKFHNVWTFDKNGKIAKSRKGLTFYRLTKSN
jgi:hypothetical protein